MDSSSSPNGNPLSPPRGFCGARTTARPKASSLSVHEDSSKGDSPQSKHERDGPAAPTPALLSAQTSEERPPASILQSQPPRCKCLTLYACLIIIWLIMTLCLAGIVLYVNIDNKVVADTLKKHMISSGMPESDVNRAAHFHRARNVLVIVSVVFVFFYTIGSVALYIYIDFFVEALSSDLNTTLNYFENAARLRFETIPTCVCEEREMDCVTERLQQFTLIPFSEFDCARRAQIWMSEASVLLREFRSTLPPDVYGDFFSNEERPQSETAVSVLAGSETEEAPPSHNGAANPSQGDSSIQRMTGEGTSSHGRGSSRDEVSLSATARTANSSSMHFSATANSSTARRDHFRVSQFLRSTANRHGAGFALGGTRSLENSMSTTQVRANFLDTLSLGLKRRRATVLIVHFAGFQNVAATSSKEARKMSDFFLKLVLRLAKPYECSVAQCRADRITLCWNTFGRQRHKDHELLAVQCGQVLSRSIEEELRRQFWRFNVDEKFSMRTVVVGFTAPVLAGLVGPNRSVRIVYGNYINLCSELLSLLVYEGSHFAWVDEPPSSLRARGMPTLEGESASVDLDAPPTSRAKPWTAIPFDTVQDELGLSHCLHEISRAYSHEVAEAHTEAYKMFAQGNFAESMRLFMKLAPEQNTAEEKANPIAARLRQLSVYYVLLNDTELRHTRPYPAWEVVPGDVLENASAPTETTAEPDTGGVRGTTLTAASRTGPERTPRSRRSDVDDLREAIEMMTAEGRRSEADVNAPATPREELRAMGSEDVFSPVTPSVGVNSGSPLLTSDAFSPINAALPPSSRGATVPPTPMDAACDVVTTSHEVDHRPHIACVLEDKKHLQFLLSPRRLGETNSSEVFLGLSFSGQQVAIKSIALIVDSGGSKPMTAVNRRRAARKGHVPLNNTKIDIDEVTREVGLLSGIRHDHIVGYVTSVVFKDHLMIIMEYVSGGSLRDVMRDFRPSVEQTRMYLNQILRGLRHLHKKNIVHCDIKPENVLVSVSGPCKLTDFGISRQISKASSAVRAEGTPCYMAPEAAEGNAVLKSDIWSFGIMMIELLTGTRPWAKELHPLAMRAQLRLGTIHPVIQGEVSDEVRRIFDLCTQREPDDRPSAEDLLKMSFFTPRQRRASLNKSNSPHRGSSPPVSRAQTTDSFTVAPTSTDPEL